MRCLRVMTAPLMAFMLTLPGCGGGGGGSTPAPAGDSVAPTVAITSPTTGATASGTTTVSATASDNVGVTKVELYVNGALAGSATAAPYSFSWNTSALSRGSYTLSAKAYDAANNVGQSVTVAVTVPITVSATTVLTGNSGVATVSLAGLATADAFGLDVVFTLPAGASIASATASGVAAGAFVAKDADGVTVHLANASGFASGEVMQVTFANVPAGATSTDIGASLAAVFGTGGTQIQ